MAALTSQAGMILIADEANNVIRQVRPDGTISSVAGVAGAGAFAGDGGPATAARLNQPTGVSPIAGGGFLIADRSNNRVRKVSASGIITTVAGSGAVCANPAGACGDGGPATATTLNAPDRSAATPDGGFLVTEDQGNKVPRSRPPASSRGSRAPAWHARPRRWPAGTVGRRPRRS